ncbi:TIGR01777 family oxidoreductase [Patulibacter defluvii]|uniref:TIGR01777 family oxidoreductase n=1 Tax=Patulibacter defluvii TaxID=3095358 RepID=UPI002A752515|nr:TIGR01777 family oxidoreductase [Patulibacter sp. DM4]
MQVTITGATGLVGSRLVERLLARGDQVTVVSRDADRARRALGDVEAHGWDADGGDDAALAAALRGRDAVVNLAGETVNQRWSDEAKRRIRDSRVATTRRLVAALAGLPEDERPATLVSGSASGYYGDSGDAVVTEDAPAGPEDDFLAAMAAAWEAEAGAAAELGLRVVAVRTGLVLAGQGGALPVIAKPLRTGLGGWIGHGRQYVPWIHLDDEVGLQLAALDHAGFRGPINASAPAPVTNKAFSKAIGRAIGRPVLVPVPALALRAALGERAQLVTDSSRMVPGRVPELGYAFAHPDLDEALGDLL